MDKKLKNHIAYMEKAAKKPSKDLLDYHLAMLQHFQHERHMHLLVTLFFAFYMIVFFIAFIALEIALPSSDSDASLLMYGVGLIDIILTITTVFYAMHYYKLENGCQRLQEITKTLYNRD